ncbi:MAG TPA: hypothetical protein P5042_05345 [Candidatus Izemoplasmatales bacterium]|nr:hypothetical protein [Candidatus Izemoplasmatales bacterium]
MYLLGISRQSIEIIIAITLLVAIIVTGVVLVIRSLKNGYKDVFKFQSKFDIELRKTINLFSKINTDGAMKEYNDVVVKNLDHEEKIKLLDLIDDEYGKIDQKDENNKYAVETYENLQEMRRIHDSKALVFNHRILMFPFNIFARFYKMKKWDLYIHDKNEEIKKN